MNAEIAAILAEPAIIERLRELGNDARPSSPEEFKDRVIADVNKWSGVVATANIERI